jgi:hypothetical protein
MERGILRARLGLRDKTGEWITVKSEWTRRERFNFTYEFAGVIKSAFIFRGVRMNFTAFYEYFFGVSISKAGMISYSLLSIMPKAAKIISAASSQQFRFQTVTPYTIRSYGNDIFAVFG